MSTKNKFLTLMIINFVMILVFFGLLNRESKVSALSTAQGSSQLGRNGIDIMPVKPDNITEQTVGGQTTLFNAYEVGFGLPFGQFTRR